MSAARTACHDRTADHRGRPGDLFVRSNSGGRPPASRSTSHLVRRCTGVRACPPLSICFVTRLDTHTARPARKAPRGSYGEPAACVRRPCHQLTRNRAAHGRSCAYRRSEPWARKPVLYAHEVILDELAQGLRPTAGDVEWFEDLSEDDQRDVSRILVLFCGQARACEEDVPEGIARSGIRPTHTPAVMLTKWRFGREGLPACERTTSFRPLVALFGIADTRRRTLYCAGECGHARHRLPDPPRGAKRSLLVAAGW